jgi:antitoxin ParD1/3/4
VSTGDSKARFEIQKWLRTFADGRFITHLNPSSTERQPDKSSETYDLFTLSTNCHNMKVMAMTSLNISLPEALKRYVETQVATGDWGTPSEYVRELIRQDKERRLSNLEQELIAATKGSKIELSVADVRKKGLLRVLREHKQK